MGYAIVFQFFEMFTYPCSCFKYHQMSVKENKFRRGLYQIYAQCIFAESRPYYQTARVSRSDVKVVLMPVWALCEQRNLILSEANRFLWGGEVNRAGDVTQVLY